MSQIPRGTLAPNSGNMSTKQLLSNSVYTQSLSSSCGRIGPPGPPGESGPKGDIGFKGLQGDKGSTGDIGDKGYKGNIGPRGGDGQKGDQGDKGDQGNKGENGPVGIGTPGPPGVGTKGDKGEIGNTGPEGKSNVGTLTQVLTVSPTANSTEITAAIKQINTNTLRSFSGDTITMGDYLKFIDVGTQIITTAPYNKQNAVYIEINGVTFTDANVNTSTLSVYNEVTFTGQLYSSGISTNGSIINTRKEGVTTGKIYAGGDLVADQGIYTNKIDSTSTTNALVIGGVSAGAVFISRSGVSTTIASSLTCNSSITGTNLLSTGGLFNINSSGGGTFSGISAGVVNLSSITSSNFQVDTTGIATLKGITTTGGVTLSYITGNGFSAASGIGYFTGVSTTGIFATSISSNIFSVDTSGNASFNQVNCGGANGITFNGTSLWLSNNAISSTGATFASVNSNGTLFCKGIVTLESYSTATAVPLIKVNTSGSSNAVTNTIGLFSRRNGISVAASSLLDLLTIPYDSVINVDQPFSIDMVLPQNPSDYSPLRFYLYNNNNFPHKLSCISQILWGPATGVNTPVTIVNLPPYKKVCVVVMSTGTGYIQSTSPLQGHYFVSYETTLDTIDTRTGILSLGTNATGITLGTTLTTTVMNGLTLTSSGISYSGNTVMLGNTLSTITIGGNTSTTTLNGLTLISSGISYSGNTVMLGNTLSTITIGGNASTTTLNGLTLISSGISYSGNTVILGDTLSTITIGGNTSTTTLNGLTLISSGISYSGNTVMLGNTLSTITIGGNASTTTLNGLTLISSGISYSGNTVGLGRTLSTITIGGNASTTTLNGLTLTSSGISYSGNTVILGNTLSTITIGGNTSTTTLNGLTLISSGISYSGNTVMLGNTLSTISIGNTDSTTNLKGNVRITNNPTFSSNAATKAYVDMIELNTLYLSTSTALSVTPSEVTTPENTVLVSFLNSNRVVDTFTLPSSDLYLIKEGYIIVNIYIKLFNSNALTFTFNINNVDSTTVTSLNNTKRLVTAYIPISSDTVIDSGLVLTIYAKSTTTTLPNAVTVYYDSSNSKLLFVNKKYPLHHQVYNPVGSIIMYGGISIPPPGYLFCDGSFYSSLSTNNPYYLLFNAIGTKYGSGTNTFAVPNLLSKFPLGSNTVSTIAVNSVSTGGSFGITIGNMPAHNHALKTGSVTGGVGLLTSSTNTTTTIDTVDTGSGLNYYQPYTVVNYIIKY